MRISFRLFVFGLVVGFLPCFTIRAADPQVWETDLSTVGGSVPKERRDLGRLLTFRHRLEFLNDDFLAVTFLIRNENLGLTTPEPGAPPFESLTQRSKWVPRPRAVRGRVR